MQTSNNYIEFKKQRELGEILSDSFVFIRNEFKPFLGTILKIVGPYILVMLISMGFYMYTIGDIFNLTAIGNTTISTYSPLIMVLAVVALLLSSIAAYVLAQGTVLHYIKSYIDNRGSTNYDEIRSGVYGSFWSLIGLGIIVGLSVFIGAMFCLIPGIYLAVPLSVSFAILVFLKKDTMESYQYSFTLIKENWWITFATLFVIYIIVAIASYAFSLPTIIYSWIKMGVFSGEMDAENFNVFNDPIYLLLNILSTLVQFLMNIIFLVATSLIFFNLNEKKNFTGTFERIESLGKSTEEQMLKKLTSLYLLLSWTILFAQNDSVVKYDESELQPIELSSEELDSYRNDSDFNYEEVKTENGWWTDIVNWFYNILRRFFEWIFGVGNAEGYLAAFLKILPYLLLALFLYLVIRFFVKSSILGMGKNKKNPNVVTLSEEEHIIKNEDIQELIKKALSDENYRLAIRYYYLYILQLLSERELIDWQQQKTNDDYMAELSNSSFKNDFGKATLLYDYVWYGEFELNQERYQKAELVFASLKKSIADV